MRRIAFWLLTVGLPLVSVESAFALEAASDAGPATATGGGLEEIVITAQRREQRLVDVPVSVSAISGEALQAEGLPDVSSLAYTNPGYLASNGVGYTQIYIRGVGNGIFVGADPSVATFIDDVPRIYGSMINTLVNVERVEVLKGAQGGLYGRNATGGVINIITLQPTSDFHVASTLSAGNYNTFDAEGYVNLPLSEKVSVNLSLTRKTHDGYVQNLAQPNQYPAGATIAGLDANNVPPGPSALNNQNFWSADSKLLVKVMDNLSVLLQADYANKNDSNGNGWFQATPANTYAFYVPFAGAFGATAVVPPFSTTPRNWKDYVPFPSFATISDYGSSATIKLGLNDLDVTSITSARWNRTRFSTDSGAVNVPTIDDSVFNEKDNAYQEFRAVSTGEGPFHYLGGVTYLRDMFHGLTNIFYFGLVPSAPVISESSSDSYSVYAQGSYDFADRITLTSSVRYVDEKKTVRFSDPYDVGQVSSHKVLPSGTLSYRLDGGIAYARYAQGFKTGGINVTVAPDEFHGQPGSTFLPESVDTYEVGYRSDFYDHKIQFTSAVFYNQYSNLQITGGGSTDHPEILTAIINAGSARTYGAESSLSWRIIAPLTVSADLGYLNAKYKTLESPDTPLLMQFNAGGNHMVLSPEWQGGASLNLDQPITSRLNWVGTVLYSYISGYYYDVSNARTTYQKDYSLVNLRAGVQTSDKRYGVYAYVNNVFDTFYTTYGSLAGFGTLLTDGDPRTIGGTVEVKF